MNEQVMPIGKYKGRSIAEIMAVDPQYIEWLTLQTWFVEKYKPTYNFIVQAGPPSEMTPEHNALQVKFLDQQICIAFAKQLLDPITLKAKFVQEAKRNWPDCYNHKIKEALRELSELKRRTYYCSDIGYKSYHALRQQKDQHSEIAKTFYQVQSKVETEQRKLLNWRKAKIDLLKRQLIELPTLELEYDIVDLEMEFVSDVYFILLVKLGKHFKYGIRYYIELKPVLGDDYPAILRQMKEQKRRAEAPDVVAHHRAQRDKRQEIHGMPLYGGGGVRHVLCFGEFTARGATLDQITAIFAQSAIHVVRMLVAEG